MVKGNPPRGQTVWGKGSVARRRCAERSELLYPFRCTVVAAGAGGGVFLENCSAKVRVSGERLFDGVEDQSLVSNLG